MFSVSPSSGVSLCPLENVSLVYGDAQSYPGVLWWVLGHSFSVTKPWSELPSQRVLERVLHIRQTQVQLGSRSQSVPQL